ncbi:hypothetical protein ABTX62_15335 [Streptomyces sp. NPDC096046]|uniref:hypothetical protein n=1 Tax=Streptomyces sp. NPDC096046 TaxID=3155542 RepID=UPI003330DE19
MIEIFDLVVEVWGEGFSWFVYPIRIPLLTVASVLVIWAALRLVVARLNGTADWTGQKVSRLLGSALLAPEYACTLFFLSQGKGIPLPLRLYGEWVENVADWTVKAGRWLGRVMRSCSTVSVRAVAVVVALYLVGYNVHAIGSAEEPASPQAPVAIWWDSLQAWLDSDEHPVWEEGTASSSPRKERP